MNRHQQRHNTSMSIAKLVNDQNILYIKIEKLLNMIEKIEVRLAAVEKVIINY